MAAAQARRATPLLSALLVGAGALLLVSLLADAPRSFVAPVNHGNARRRVAMHGFKEDFDAWKSGLSDDEKAMIQEQAEGEFNKKFRKSDAFKKDLAEDKIKSFGKILGKFFDAEAEDYKKEQEGKPPEYDALLKKAAEGGLDFSLKRSIAEYNRDAERRYDYVSQKILSEGAKGKRWPQSSPLQEIYKLPNDDKDSHDYNLGVLEFLKKAAKEDNCPPEAKKFIAEWEKKGIPKMGEPFEVKVPQVMANQVAEVQAMLAKGVEKMKESKSEAEVKAFMEEEMPDGASQVIATLTETYVKARDEVEEAITDQKNFFKSQQEKPGKTKADLLKEIWAELPKYSESPVPPLDDEMLAELALEPYSEPEEFKHSWGTADVLWKSEAIDAFGGKYLLGLFETKEEAAKAFDAWNAEYENARKSLKDEMAQWTKQEQARMDADVEGQARVKEILSGTEGGAGY